MFNIEQYLKKFSLRIDDVTLQKEKVILIFKDRLNVVISKEDIEIKNSMLTLKLRPIIRSELMLKKEKILEELKVCGIVNIR